MKHRTSLALAFVFASLLLVPPAMTATTAPDSLAVGAGPFTAGQSVTFTGTYHNNARHSVSKRDWASSPYATTTQLPNPVVYLYCYDTNPVSPYYGMQVQESHLTLRNATEHKNPDGSFTASASTTVNLDGRGLGWGNPPAPIGGADSAYCAGLLTYFVKTHDGVEQFTIADASFEVLPRL